ncbi:MULTISPECIES: CaiB/BaiF CoA transferase family protein [Streptomyces violaceusniger group]|uniref:CaiB/BaiF CoA-transferase family protein n=2 Tax=Streptomyces javensis TaxID=114698 RepID=A0ABN1WNM5_9ACTN|nr:CaiB/BaiF CoA-transferase family protein [Streptomyces javensis]MBI0312229.1 CoA transferase [Streptomyces javensis]
MNTRRLPLDGVVVVDFTQVYAGPSCTQMLGDFGADVIKIERPGTGDLSRTSFPDEAGLDNPVFWSINRNKRSVSLDTRTEEGKQAVLDLVSRADVVTSNFRAGVMDRIGFGYEALRAVNPGVIWASATGFGEKGPYAHKGGQDILTQAYTGVMWRRASDDTPVSIYPTSLCDYTTGMHMVQGILLALLHRERTGEGQKVEIAMYDSILHMQMQEAATRMNRDTEINWAAMPLTGAYRTTDGAVVMVGAFKQNPLRDICAALEIGEDLSLRPEYTTPEGQQRHRPELRRLFAERFATGTTAHWMKRLEAQDLLCAPVRTMEEALRDEQTIVNGMIVEMEHPAEGSVRVLGNPVHLSATPAEIRRVPPGLGEHGDEVLGEAGYDAARLRALREAGVLR